MPITQFMKNSEQPIQPIIIDNDTVTFAYIEKYSKDYSFGLTKREHFAALAMQGLLANPTINAQIGVGCKDNNVISIIAIAVADALLAELEKPG